MTSDAAGNIYAAGEEDGIVRIDRITGAKETLNNFSGLDPADMVLGPDGKLVIANETFAGSQLVTFDPVTRQRGIIDTSTNSPATSPVSRSSSTAASSCWIGSGRADSGQGWNGRGEPVTSFQRASPRARPGPEPGRRPAGPAGLSTACSSWSRLAA